jgi:uncharacterized membrane protein YqiK
MIASPDREDSMSNSVLLAIVIAVAVVAIIALWLNRRLKITSAHGGLEVGEDQRAAGSMTVSATGSGSTVERSKQIQQGAGPAMDIKAADGGRVLDPEQRSGDE